MHWYTLDSSLILDRSDAILFLEVKSFYLIYCVIYLYPFSHAVWSHWICIMLFCFFLLLIQISIYRVSRVIKVHLYFSLSLSLSLSLFFSSDKFYIHVWSLLFLQLSFLFAFFVLLPCLQMITGKPPIRWLFRFLLSSKERVS